MNRLPAPCVEWNLHSVSCNTTVQVYNVLQLGELYDYLATGFENVVPIPRLSPLFTPSYLSIQVLPPKVKDTIRPRLMALTTQAESRLRVQHQGYTKYIDSVIAFMEAAQVEGPLASFFYFSEKSDRQCKDSWRDACPEPASLLLKTGQPV